MITNIKSDDNLYKLTGKTYWPLFGCEVKVRWGEGADVSIEYAEKCVSQLLNLDKSTVEQLLKASICFFYDEERCNGEPLTFMFEFEDMEYPKELDVSMNILPYIMPVEMYIDKEIAGCYSISVFSECAAMSNTFPIVELRSLLEKAKVTDAALKQFGAESHKYQWNPPASLKEIEEFEQETGIVLPDGYRNFLLQAGNGGAGPFYGLFPISASKGWPIEPDKLPWLTPDKSVEELEDVPDWKRGCIPIGSQGDTYITCLMVTGPDRGRVVYIEYERSWIFFPREPDFLSWYTRWLREAASGYDMGWFGIFLDGDEETLQKNYAQADTEEERLLAIDSMEKFPDLSDASQHFICSILDEWVMKEDVGSLPRLAYRVDPELY